MEIKSTPLYHSYLDDLSGYSDGECGRLMRGLLRFSRDGAEPEGLRRKELLV